MGIISSYADDASTSDTDRFLTYASDGSTKLSPASNLKTYLGFTTNPGGSWASLANTPNSITASGNRSYNMVFNAVDLTSALSPGMRLMTTRTVAAPTKCTSLNGSTQYFNKTTPAGMTFTDNFTAMGWVKATAYGNNAIIARVDGTAANGWFLDTTTAGQPRIGVYNAGAANFRTVSTYQSIPLNKWVHIAMTWAAGTVTAYIDGVSVPVSAASTSGTNPTTCVNTGDLAIGRLGSSSAEFWAGKIAQAAIFSAVLNQATIQSYISQGLIGTETSLVSAYSFNNSINDLNANANNLTANGSAVATNADSPFGGQADGTISSTLDYAIVTKTAFSTNTTLTVQVPEGCTIPTSGGVSAVSYATVKAPYGMPVQRGKWTIEAYTPGVSGATVTAGAWNLPTGGIQSTIPIGSWDLSYASAAIIVNAVADVVTTLSSTTNSASDSRFNAYVETHNVSVSGGATLTGRAFVDLSVATPYYVLYKPGTGSSLYTSSHPPKLVAELAYL